MVQALALALGLAVLAMEPALLAMVPVLVDMELDLLVMVFTV